MATIKNELSISGPTSPFFVIVAYKTTAPSIEVARVVYRDGVSTNPFKFTFTDLPNGTYIVKVHASADGIALGTLRHDYWIDAVTGFTTQDAKYFVVNSGIGSAPADGTTAFNDATIVGKGINWVFQTGFRFLMKGVEWQELAGGGFELLGGLKFDDNVTYFYEVEEVISSVAPTPDDSFSEILQFSGNVTIGSAQYNKTILGNSSNVTQIFTITSTGVPDGKGYIFIHDGGNAVNLHLTGGVFRFRGADVTDIYLGKGEKVKMLRKGAKWYVVDYLGQWAEVGHRASVDKIRDNMLQADGLTTYAGTTYKRIWDYLINELPVAQRVDFTTYDATTVINGVTVYPNRGYWAVDTVAQTFKTPDMRGQTVRNLATIGGANKPGQYKHWQVGEHDHTGLEAENTSHGASSSTQTVPNVKLLVNTSAGSVTTIAQAKTGKHNIGGENQVKGFELLPVVLI